MNHASMFVKCILVMAVLSCGVSVSGVTPELRGISAPDGLSDLLVNTIYKDSAGYVWMGTETALDRYDGNIIKTFSFPGDEHGPRRVNAITEMRRGEIFVGNHQGLYVLSPGADNLVRVSADKIAFPVNALAHDGRDNLYVGSRHGVFCYNVAKNSIRQTLLRPDVLDQNNEVTGLWLRPDSGLWISTYHTLYFSRPDGRGIESFQMPFRNPCTGLTGVGDTLWLSTNGSGAVPFDMQSRRFLPAVELGNNIITSLCGDGGGHLFIATDGEGIFRYSIPAACVTAHYTSSHDSPLRLNSNSVYSLAFDDKGLLWIGYYQAGAEYTPYYNTLFEVYADELSGFDSRNMAVRAVAIDGPRKVIGTREGLYYIDESKGRAVSFKKPLIASNIIFCIRLWRDRYYIGTYNGGMYELDPATSGIRPVDTGAVDLSSAVVFAIEVDREGSMWAATSNGVLRFRDGRLTDHFTSANSQLPDGNVYELFFDSAGRGWICTESGMAIWNGTSIRADRFPKGFINNLKVREVYEDREHNLFFAPDRGELFRSNLELTEYGFINPSVNAGAVTFVSEDPDGWLWLGTDKGLVRYNKHDHFHLFNNAYGVPSLVFTLCTPVVDPQGNMWFGNSQGLLRLDFGRFKRALRPHRPELVVTGIKSNGHDITNRLTDGSYGKQIELGEQETDIQVSVTDFSYFPSEYNAVEYKLDGYEDVWRSTDGRRPIHYYDLAPGDYMLRVRLTGNPDTETVMRVHRSGGVNWPVLTCVLVGVLLCGFAVYMLFVRRRHREELDWVESWMSPASSEAAASPADAGQVRYRTTRLSDEECKRLVKVLDGVMKESKPYTNPDLKSSQLAEMAGTTGHALSYIFNQYMKKSYYDYVNSYRVEEFKRLVREVDTSRYTLTALAQKCGFSSRASFFRHFKSITGITPAEYLKRR